jgi:hypothetical protein
VRASARALGAITLTIATSAWYPAAAQTKAECLAAFERGQEEQRALHLRAARDLFRSCTRPACSPPVRSDCAEHLDEVVRAAPTLVVGARDTSGADLPGVLVFVDGERVITDPGGTVIVDPGPHTLRFELPPFSPQSQEIVARTGERSRLVIATFPADAARERPSERAQTGAGGGRSPWAYVAGGIGGVALSSFAFFGITGAVERSDLIDRGCKPNCPDDQISDVRTKFIIADISLGVAIVSLAAATFLFLKEPTPSRPVARSSWR